MANAEIRPLVPQVGVLIREGEPWFFGADVARILGYRRVKSVIGWLWEDEAATSNDGVFVAPGALFELVACIDKPAARKLYRRVREAADTLCVEPPVMEFAGAIPGLSIERTLVRRLGVFSPAGAWQYMALLGLLGVLRFVPGGGEKWPAALSPKGYLH